MLQAQGANLRSAFTDPAGEHVGPPFSHRLVSHQFVKAIAIFFTGARRTLRITEQNLHDASWISASITCWPSRAPMDTKAIFGE